MSLSLFSIPGCYSTVQPRACRPRWVYYCQKGPYCLAFPKLLCHSETGMSCEAHEDPSRFHPLHGTCMPCPSVLHVQSDDFSGCRAGARAHSCPARSWLYKSQVLITMLCGVIVSCGCAGEGSGVEGVYAVWINCVIWLYKQVNPGHWLCRGRQW